MPAERFYRLFAVFLAEVAFAWVAFGAGFAFAVDALPFDFI